jgi:serine phosphatase RsbU (regulator of sigma subunit)/putative methionine-R-sulfoxide reductase with GAF domain
MGDGGVGDNAYLRDVVVTRGSPGRSTDHGVAVDRFLRAHRASHVVEDAASALLNDLVDAADSAITDDSLEALYTDALGAIRELLDADSVAILLANETGEALIARASVGLGQHRPVGLTIRKGEGMAGRVLASREPVIVDDLSKVALASPTLRIEGLQSVVAVPIESEKKLLGVLHVGSRQLAHFNEADAELLAFLGDRVALALERVRLFEQQRQLARMGTFLAEAGKIIAEATDLEDTLERLARTALLVVGDICLVDVNDEGTLKRLVARHKDSSQQYLADRLRSHYPLDPSGPHPAAEVMRSGHVSWSAHMSDDFLKKTTRDPDHFALTKALGFRSYIAIPIGSNHDVVGTLTMVSCSRRFRAEDVELAQALARQVGAVVGKAQQLDLARRTSHVLQASLLPRTLPDIPGILVHSCYEAAAKSLDVGGDFYDVVHLPGGKAWFMVGDVEGHDRNAAALMGQLRSAARIVAVKGASPAEVVQQLQESWDLMAFERIATVLFGRLDPGVGTLTLASAGHYPPLLLHGRTAEYLPVPAGPPLGSSTKRPSELIADLEVGDILLLYTDGAINERTIGVERAMEQLVEVVLGSELTAEAICDQVLLSQSGHEDDIALLALQRQ